MYGQHFFSLSPFSFDVVDEILHFFLALMLCGSKISKKNRKFFKQTRKNEKFSRESFSSHQFFSFAFSLSLSLSLCMFLICFLCLNFQKQHFHQQTTNLRMFVVFQKKIKCCRFVSWIKIVKRAKKNERKKWKWWKNKNY